VKHSCCICGAVIVDNACRSCGHPRCVTCRPFEEMPTIDESIAALRRSGFTVSADGRTWVPPVNEAAAQLHRARAILGKMVSDDAFAELCAGIGEEPEWLKMARAALADSEDIKAPKISLTEAVKRARGSSEPPAIPIRFAESEMVSVPKDVLQRICGMVYATRSEQIRMGYINDTEYRRLVSLRHGGNDSIATVLSALEAK
jgi:hypothetical protein